MELTRRRFGKMLMAVAVAIVTGAWKGGKRLVPVRLVEAVRAKTFPGRISPLNEAKVKKQAKWGG